MNVYICDDHDNHYVGVASVVVAETEEQAREILDAELARHGLRGFDKSPYTLRKLNLAEPKAVVMQDGDY